MKFVIVLDRKASIGEQHLSDGDRGDSYSAQQRL